MGVQCLLGLTATATMATVNSVAEHLGIVGDSDAIVRGCAVPNNLMLSVSRDSNRERVSFENLCYCISNSIQFNSIHFIQQSRYQVKYNNMKYDASGLSRNPIQAGKEGDLYT